MLAVQMWRSLPRQEINGAKTKKKRGIRIVSDSETASTNTVSHMYDNGQEIQEKCNNIKHMI